MKSNEMNKVKSEIAEKGSVGNMKQGKVMTNRGKAIITRAVVYVNTLCAGLLLSMNSVHAVNSNTGSIDSFITFVCDWLLKIGGVVAMVGAVMFALGWQRDDTEGKSRGLMTMMAGFMVAAISQAPSIFGL